MFLMPGLGSPELPRAFAAPTAYGDLTAATLARLGILCLHTESTLAGPVVWLFNVEGVLDLIYANIATFKEQIDPTYLGVSYYLAAVNVPAMVVVHVLIFIYLLKKRQCGRTDEKVSAKTEQSVTSGDARSPQYRGESMPGLTIFGK
jgi:hypothetical protein